LENPKETNILEDFGTGGIIIIKISIFNNERRGFIWFVIGRRDSFYENCNELPDFIICRKVSHKQRPGQLLKKYSVKWS